FMGNRTVTVMSGSMEPAIWIGSAVVSSPVPSKDLTAGDVIVYSLAGAALPLVHRIVSIEERDGTRYYRTRGDANPTQDPAEFTLAANAWRLSYSVPFAGYLIFAVSKPAGQIATLMIPITAMVLLAGKDWVKKARRGRMH